ncbi:FMN-binding protein [Streptomyces sp. NPDC001922]|uniref:FMN-binding protein n=1 Tax=Streptomyces sp. NPDC001922 TaxID=3364624 RepID=UPI0036C728AA
MRTHPIRRILLTSAATVSGVVLLLALKAPGLPGASAEAGAPAAQASAPAQPGNAGGQEAGQAPPSSGGESGARTVTGKAVRTDYGPVQVRISLSGGRITAATAAQAPSSSPKSKQITAKAVPRLGEEAVAAQSAEIDAVSGATYTSQGYRESLQSALDEAR